MAVAPLSHSARDYVRAFDLTCIALWRDGRLGVSRNPTGADQAWWCPAKDAGAVVRAANANGKDVTAAAQLHTPLTDHVTVAERATEAVDRIDCTLNAARLRGDLAFLNSAYPKSDLRFQDHALGTFGHSSNCIVRSDAQYREYFSCARYALFALA